MYRLSSLEQDTPPQTKGVEVCFCSLFRKISAEMSGSVSVCNIDPGLVEEIRKFRFSRDVQNRALIMKVDRESQTVIKEELLEDLTVDELRESLPESQPRFLIYSYKLEHDDGRISYPLCFIFSTPSGCKMEMRMMYAGSKLNLVKQAELSKVFEIRDLEDLTEDWLEDMLKK